MPKLSYLFGTAQEQVANWSERSGTDAPVLELRLVPGRRGHAGPPRPGAAR